MKNQNIFKTEFLIQKFVKMNSLILIEEAKEELFRLAKIYYNETPVGGLRRYELHNFTKYFGRASQLYFKRLIFIDSDNEYKSIWLWNYRESENLYIVTNEEQCFYIEFKNLSYNDIKKRIKSQIKDLKIFTNYSDAYNYLELD